MKTRYIAPRYPAKISVAYSPTANIIVTAIATDGTMWIASCASDTDGAKWNQLPPLPQPEGADL